MSGLKIFVPTRGRLDRQITLGWIQDVTMVVPECEERHWDEPKIVVPDAFCFSDVRQVILSDPAERHLVLDDDLLLYRRTDKLRKATPTDVISLLHWIETKMDEGYVHGGVGFRAFNNQYADDDLERENMVCICAHFYRADVLRAEGLRYDAIPGKCDLHSTLSLLELGYPNVVTNEWVHHQECGKPGGCSRYRTPEMVSESSRILQRLHPEVVTLRDKKGMDETRISWKKALGIKEHLRKWNT